MGAILEIRIPNEKLYKYKTERGKDKYIREAVWDFMVNGLKKIGKFDVYYTNGMDTAYDGEELCEINDIGYAAHNKVKQNKDKRTFRFFGGRIINIVPDVEIPEKDKFVGIHDKNPDIIKFKGNEFSVVTSMYAEHKKRN